MDDPEREIQRILKIAGGQYLNESAKVLNKLYFKGNYQNVKVNNRLIADMMEITTIKASKILSVLARINLIRKATEENAYFIHDIKKLYQICLDQLNKSWKGDIQAINNIFSKKIFTPFVENVNIFTMYHAFKDMFRATNLRSNIYLEINSGGPACCTPFDNLDRTTQKFLNEQLSKGAYDIFHERYKTLKWRLEEQKRRNIEEGTVYYIICVYSMRSLILKLSEKNGLDPIHSYKIFLKNLELFFQDCFDFLINGQLQILIDLEHKNINGPLGIFGNNAYLCLIENPIILGNYRVLHYYDPEIIRFFTTSYKTLFENMMRLEGYSESKEFSNFLLHEKRCKWLYESQLRKIQNEIQFIEKNYLKK
ncbi:MAG: hypothetical protein ACTSVY_07535 [Candidatus Helarchaeota archaeon]